MRTARPGYPEDMSTSPEEPINDPTEFPDSGPDIDPPAEDETPENPFAPGEGFTPGSDPQLDPQSHASL